jgi:glyoxylase-like metal-dependent hydrolase (beta-lactamase superfamily II)
MTRIFHLFLLTALMASCASPTPEQQVLESAADALGGRDRLLDIDTLVLEGEGTLWNVGQDMTMEATGQTFAVTGYRRAMGLDGVRMRIEQTRTPNFLYFQGQAPQKQVFGVDGDVAYTIAANGTPSRAGAQAARDRRAELYHHPVVLVRAALGQGAIATNARTDGGLRLVDITVGDAGPFTLAIDSGTGVPSRISSAGDHPNLGDVVVETSFEDYTDLNGVMVPQHLTTRIDRFKTAELRLSRPMINGDASNTAAPESVRAGDEPGPPAVNVVEQAVAPGVWLLAGQSHHSVLVEFDDHLMLIEAPQSEARTLGAIAKARELVPGKPLTQLVSSHHHFDHSAGLRAAVAEGLTVLTHSGNVAYYEEAAKRPHTASPDALSSRPRPATIESVDDSRVIEDRSRRVELYHISGNAHADTLLMVYLPRERVLVEVDAYSPGSAVQPYAANLLEQIRARKLRVDRVVPLHGTVVPFGELVKAVPQS